MEKLNHHDLASVDMIAGTAGDIFGLQLVDSGSGTVIVQSDSTAMRSHHRDILIAPKD